MFEAWGFFFFFFPCRRQKASAWTASTVVGSQPIRASLASCSNYRPILNYYVLLQDKIFKKGKFLWWAHLHKLFFSEMEWVRQQKRKEKKAHVGSVCGIVLAPVLMVMNENWIGSLDERQRRTKQQDISSALNGNRCLLQVGGHYVAGYCLLIGKDFWVRCNEDPRGA